MLHKDLVKIDCNVTQRSKGRLNHLMENIGAYGQIRPGDHAVSLGNTGKSAKRQKY